MGEIINEFAACLKDIFIMKDMCYIAYLLSFRSVWEVCACNRMPDILKYALWENPLAFNLTINRSWFIVSKSFERFIKAAPTCLLLSSMLFHFSGISFKTYWVLQFLRKPHHLDRSFLLTRFQFVYAKVSQKPLTCMTVSSQVCNFLY